MWPVPANSFRLEPEIMETVAIVAMMVKRVSTVACYKDVIRIWEKIILI